MRLFFIICTINCVCLCVFVMGTFGTRNRQRKAGGMQMFRKRPTYNRNNNRRYMQLLRGPAGGIALMDHPTGFKIDSCDSEMFAKKQQANLSCIPRETVVNLYDWFSEHGPYNMYIQPAFLSPNVVLVNRCAGMCNAHIKCVATKVATKKIAVRQFKNNQKTCLMVDIPEDISCDCRCPQRATDCQPQQEYDEVECKCKCKRPTKPCEQRQYFDDEKCECKCKKMKKGNCTTGSKWDSTQCRCIKRKKNEKHSKKKQEYPLS